jgi:hypothetical protein
MWSSVGTKPLRSSRVRADNFDVRRRRALSAAALVAGAAGAALPAPGADAATALTGTLAAGTLSITVPTSANLGSATVSSTGTSVSGHLGTTTVNDSRGSLAGWTVTISATNLSDGATPTPHTIAASKMKVYIAVGDGPTLTSGVAVPVTAYSTALTALTLSTSGQTLLSATTTGSNVVTYNPTVSVAVGGGAIAGTYTGTITQTVS